MKRAPFFSWALFALYALWFSALQGALAAHGPLPAWTPDLGLVLLFAWAARLRERAPLAALTVALARATFSADPPAAVAAGVLGALGLFAVLRSGLEVDRALPRAFLCGLGAFGLGGVLLLAREVALADQASGAGLEGVRLWPMALATALACLVSAPLCQRLPGLAPLRRRA
ncbi:MAG: hypothetical protein EXS08_01620 [Planctomycetes bacterium]|nr:hypothetical protein [Planctomycetota bacterium]